MNAGGHDKHPCISKGLVCTCTAAACPVAIPCLCALTSFSDDMVHIWDHAPCVPQREPLLNPGGYQVGVHTVASRTVGGRRHKQVQAGTSLQCGRVSSTKKTTGNGTLLWHPNLIPLPRYPSDSECLSGPARTLIYQQQLPQALSSQRLSSSRADTPLLIAPAPAHPGTHWDLITISGQ
jgi:hypothetical protein